MYIDIQYVSVVFRGVYVTLIALFDIYIYDCKGFASASLMNEGPGDKISVNPSSRLGFLLILL